MAMSYTCLVTKGILIILRMLVRSTIMFYLSCLVCLLLGSMNVIYPLTLFLTVQVLPLLLSCLVFYRAFQYTIEVIPAVPLSTILLHQFQWYSQPVPENYNPTTHRKSGNFSVIVFIETFP